MSCQLPSCGTATWSRGAASSPQAATSPPTSLGLPPPAPAQSPVPGRPVCAATVLPSQLVGGDLFLLSTVTSSRCPTALRRPMGVWGGGEENEGGRPPSTLPRGGRDADRHHPIPATMDTT